MYFEELHQRLVETAQKKVRAGQATERGLARLCGVSQPHMHNVLKNIRMLSTSSADRLMQALNVNVPELIWRLPDDIEGGVRAVPLIRNRIGPGCDAVLDAFRGYVPLPFSLTRDLVDPVAARLAPDLAMPRVLTPNDLVLLDQNPAHRARPAGGGCWVVAEPTGLRVRYLKLGGTRAYLANEITVAEPMNWQSVPLQDRNILQLVRARIVWMGRDMES